MTGNYYNNRWLYGTPIDTEIDSNLSINWGSNLVTSTASDYVSVTWTGYIKPLYDELYNFTIISDDGSRLYIDSELVFDNFLSAAGTFSGSYTFNQKDILYPIQIDYRENTNTANIKLFWKSTNQSFELVPSTALFASASHIMSSPFTIAAT